MSRKKCVDMGARALVLSGFAAMLLVACLAVTGGTGAVRHRVDVEGFQISANLANLQKIQAVDGVAGDQFGGSVAISGNTAVIGANATGLGVGGPGFASVFVRSGSTWTFQQKLTAADGAADDAFGSYVAIDGNTIIVGAFADNVGSNAQQGSAYIFTRNGTVWTQQQKLLAADGAPNDVFGRSVAIAGDTVAITSVQGNVGSNPDQGAAYIFTRTGTVWTQQQKLTAADGVSRDFFGDSIAIAGDTVIVGVQDDSTGATMQHGSAYIFTRTGTVWTQQQKLMATDNTSADYFGFSVAVNGDTAVVGTLQDVGTSPPVFNQGSVYVFVRSGTVWTQQQKLLASDGAAGDTFGNSVAVEGDTIIVGASGDTNATNARQGSAYTFTRTGTAWTQQQKLSATDGAAEDQFGASVALAGNIVFIGSLGDTIGANSFQGSAYVFAPVVMISGRVSTPAGLSLRNAIVSITDSLGARRTATTSSFGNYSFDNVRPDETYIITVSSKRYRFAPLSMLVSDNLINVNFIGLE